MLSKSVQDAINEQIKNELYSGYLYLAVAAHFESTNLPGFAHWMKIQATEEVKHAMKFFEYVNERGGKVTLKAIEQPPVDFKSPLDVFKMAHKHEQKVTGMIHKLYELALKENDYPSQVMLQWFIKEQVEEEKNAENIVEQLKMAGDSSAALLMADRQFAARKAD
ncbi:MAG TPA: ferritin [Bacteroidota bacterium]